MDPACARFYARGWYLADSLGQADVVPAARFASIGFVEACSVNGIGSDIGFWKLNWLSADLKSEVQVRFLPRTTNG